MMNSKALLVGGFLGILATLGGVKLAHANCDAGEYEAARQLSALCPVDGGVVETVDGWQAYCSTADELQACEAVSERLECAGLTPEACDVAMGQAYSACLVVAAFTPGAVK